MKLPADLKESQLLYLVTPHPPQVIKLDLKWCLSNIQITSKYPYNNFFAEVK